jgi:hypothetical protein
MDPCAGGLTGSRRNSLRITRVQIHQIDLEERIARLAFTLEDHASSVGAEVAFAGAAAFEGELADAVYELRFEASGFGGIGFGDVGVSDWRGCGRLRVNC